MSARSIRREHERVLEQERKRSGRRGRAKSFAGAAAVAVGASVLFAPGASAANFVVDTTADGDDDDCFNGDCTLREAAFEANDLDGSDTITFASNVTGTIALDDTLGQINLYDDGVDIQGPGAGVLTVSGGEHDIVFKVFGFDQENTPVRIAGLTIADGFIDTGVGGAGIRSYDGADFAADLTVADSVLTNNSAETSGASGGALYQLDGSLTVTNSTLSGNYAYSDGGGIWTDLAALTITGSTISGNDSDDGGGGIYVQDTPGGGTDVRIADSTITGNESFDDEGGGVYLDEIDGDAVIERSTISNNDAFDQGGGIYIHSDVDDGVTIDASTISGNDASSGGGVYVDDVDYAVAITNSTISGNSALYDGGGIAINSDDDEDENISIRNSTIARNTAAGGTDPSGGGLYLNVFDNAGTDTADPVAISSTIIADNTSTDGPDVFEPLVPEVGGLNVGFSLIESTSGATINGTGPNVPGTDPQLGVLQNNGGPTETQAPSFTSPVLDMGIGNGLGTDQRGSLRTFDAANFANAAGGDGTDIGSVELLPGGKVSAALAQCKGATENLLFAPGTAIVGTDANDVIVGTSGNDNVNAGKGKDKVCAQGGNDTVKAGAGKDNVAGQAGKDKLKGNAGNDKLQGNAGKDTLKGGGGKDTLKGGGGKDILKGGPGKDTLKGGGGKDSETQ